MTNKNSKEEHPVVGEHFNTFTTIRSKLHKGEMDIPNYISFLIEEAAFIAMNSGVDELTAVMTLNQMMFDSIANELSSKCPNCKAKKDAAEMIESEKPMKKAAK